MKNDSGWNTQGYSDWNPISTGCEYLETQGVQCRNTTENSSITCITMFAKPTLAQLEAISKQLSSRVNFETLKEYIYIYIYMYIKI